MDHGNRILWLALLWALPLVGLGAEPASDWGLQAGDTTGSGLVWRHWDGTQGYQLSLFPQRGTTFGDTQVQLEAGVAGLWSLHEGPNTRFYGYLGASGGVDWDRWDGWQAALRPGAGMGLELILFEHLVFDLRSGPGATVDLVHPALRRLGLVMEAGLSYRL